MYKKEKSLMKFIFTLCFLLVSITIQGAELISLETRPRVQQKFILMKPEKAIASVILFAGGHGMLDLQGASDISWGKNNFLVRTRDLFVEHGFIVAVVDAPSDHLDYPGMLFGFRDSDEHVTDIDHVISYLNKQGKLPVWLIGTSRGTESAAHIAIESKKKPHGLILTSSMSVENDKGTAVNEMDLSKIKIPTLITAHEDDGCHVTPPEGAQEIEALLTNTVKVEVKMFSGGDEILRPCKAKTFHGYLDIEEKVINAISNFIKSN